MRTSLFLAVLAIPAVMAAQPTSAPPIKMGLWQNTNVVSVKGLHIPPDVAARLKAMGRPVPTEEPRTVVVDSCITPEKWKEMFSNMQQGKNCKYSNLHQDSSGISTDIACSSEDGKRTTAGHFDLRVLSQEKTHGQGKMTSMLPSQPNPIIVDMTIDGVYLGSDCKGISPDSPKVVQPAEQGNTK